MQYSSEELEELELIICDFYDCTIFRMTANFTRNLLAAEGYLELGMLDRASLELEQIEPELRAGIDVMTMRCQIFMAAKQWEAAQDVAKHLVSLNPKEVQHWILAGYATRRAVNIEAARDILLRAKPFHPDEPMLDYNLACYVCQLGQIDEAKALLKVAISAKKEFKAMALDDPDLGAMW